ncbi:MAG TPA: serine hydrolase domain-containing protein [Bacteroidales bacterium]|jgi:CubicO group peptidase (beta-lactamase class C family)|nr:beta-lactamase family protein [Bacteroidales bacterium]MDI9573993.1 serine hydrolase domain-containing protein [Bacteroidota bacterium]OQC60635.1 MAG: Penicillin-binding protein 4* [Bacteroidetes bacterium ADurb.Bin012]MBP9511477.1 beta-lactamase family protein [Bacteroidales bacterium]MBP9589157.1 beta-lactamase family protein [Bacteroidales bacterium]
MKNLKYGLAFFFILFIYGKSGGNRASDVSSRGDLPSEPPFIVSKADTISKTIDGIIHKAHFNGSILVGYKDYVLYENAIGLINLRTNDSLSAETPFQLASVSKSFTALAVLMLVQDSLLDLEDKVKNHIPEFPYPTVTVKHLLNHTSGIPNYFNLATRYWPKNKPMNNEDMLKLLVKHKLRLQFTPGTKFSYSNTGYAVLALLVERVSKTSFNEFLKNRIFIPLGMYHTFTYDRQTMDTIATALGHRSSHPNTSLFEYDPIDEVLGDKSIFSTPADLFQYNQAWTTDILIKENLRKEAFTRATLKNHSTVDYGFGWRFKKIEGKDIIYHNGLWHGFTATYTRIPDNELTIIILNNTNSHVSTIAQQIWKEIAPILELEQSQQSTAIN